MNLNYFYWEAAITAAAAAAIAILFVTAEQIDKRRRRPPVNRRTINKNNTGWSWTCACGAAGTMPSNPAAIHDATQHECTRKGHQ